MSLPGNLGERLFAARRAAAAGRYEEALREHVWFHDEALKIDPAYYGVRLSFALSDWLELGKRYPVALTTLRAVRDRKTEQMLRGEGTRALFHDVAAINHYLDEAARTHTLFRRVAEMAPDLARQCGSLAMPVLVAAGDFDLAKQFLPDLDAHVRALANRCNDRAGDLQQRPNPVGSSALEQRAVKLRADAQLYAEELRLILTVLEHTGRLPEAVRLRAQALALVADDSMRESVRLLLPEPG